MPYEWLPTPAPDARLHLWPYRSLPRAGFVWFIGATCALIAMPLIAVLGTPVLWMLLPFLGIAVAGVWYALHRSYKDAEIVEDLTLSPGTMTLTRHGPRGTRRLAGQPALGARHHARNRRPGAALPDPVGQWTRGGTGGLFVRRRTNRPARRFADRPCPDALTDRPRQQKGARGPPFFVHSLTRFRPACP